MVALMGTDSLLNQAFFFLTVLGNVSACLLAPRGRGDFMMTLRNA